MMVEEEQIRSRMNRNFRRDSVLRNLAASVMLYGHLSGPGGVTKRLSVKADRLFSFAFDASFESGCTVGRDGRL